MKRKRKTKVTWTAPPMTKAEKWERIMPPYQIVKRESDSWNKPDGSSLKNGDLCFLQHDSMLWNDKIGLMWGIPPLVRCASYFIGDGAFARKGSACIYAGHMHFDEDKNEQAY